MRRLLGPLALAATVALVAGTAGAQTPVPKSSLAGQLNPLLQRPCRPSPQAIVVARSALVLAYLQPYYSVFTGHSEILFACVIGTSRTVKLDYPSDGDSVLPRPFAVSGTRLAFVYLQDSGTGPDFNFASAIRVVDLRTGRDVEPTGPAPAGYVDPSTVVQPDFGPDAVSHIYPGAAAFDLILAPSGALAWTTCADINFNGTATLTDCTDPSFADGVYVHVPGHFLPTMLGAGQIALHSLRLTAGILSWTQNGHQKTAPL
jgi:hypothetical protein